MSERAGILAAIVSSALGGTAVAMTRYLHGTVDAVTLAAFSSEAKSLSLKGVPSLPAWQ